MEKSERSKKTVWVSKEKKLKYIRKIIGGMSVIDATREIYGYGISKKELMTKRTYVYSWVYKYKTEGVVRKGVSGKGGINKASLLRTMWISIDSITKRHIDKKIVIKKHKDAFEAMKKGSPNVRRGIVNKIAKKHMVPIFKVLNFFDFPKSTYYSMVKKKPRKKKYDKNLVELVEKIYYDSKGVYGRNRIKVALKYEYGIDIGVKVVQGIMGQLGIKSLIRIPKIKREKRKYVQTKDLIKRNWKSSVVKHKLYNDVSYIPIKGGFAYLALTLDGFNNEVVGWSLSLDNDQANIANSLRPPLKESKSSEIIVHTDHASVYHSDDVRSLLKKYKAKHSMGRVGVSLDNRPIEYMFSIIKQECIRVIDKKSYDLSELTNELSGFIWYYNNKRRQSGLNYLSPILYKKSINI